MPPIYHPSDQFFSPGGQFVYQVVGPVCRLYDREQLPWPCCRLEWKSKEPSWNRIGRRFVPDISAKQRGSYCVQLIEYPQSQPFVLTLFWQQLAPETQQWWYRKRFNIERNLLNQKTA